MENIELIQKTAVEAAGMRQIKLSGHNSGSAIILGREEQLKSLESLQGGRDRYRGTLKTTSIDDFASYVQIVSAASPAVGFVDVANMASTVFFNLGTVEDPGHGDWYATLTMQRTAAFEALHKIDGVKNEQKALTDWLEDWSDFLVADFAEGDATLARAVAALRKLKISAKAETTSNVGDFNASRSALEDVEASSADLLPIGFRLATEPYEGLSTRSFALRLSVLTGGEKPLLVLRWQRKEAALEAIAREFKSVLAEKIGSGVPLTIGTFSP